MMDRAAAMFTLITLFASVCHADVVHLKDGGTFEGRVEDLGDSVRIESGGAVFTLPKSRIERIEIKKLPHEIHAEKMLTLDDSNPKECLELALWCRENGLDEEYAELLQKVLSIEPNHATASRLLYEYNKTELTLPVSRAVSEMLTREFGNSFRIKRTRHYRICYNCDQIFLQARCYLLENVYRKFYSLFESNGFKLETLRDRLEVVLFGSRKDFVAYLRREAAKPSIAPDARASIMTMMRSAGMYWQTKRRVLFYNALHDESYEKAQREIEQRERAIKEMKRHLSRAPSDGFFEVIYPDGRRERIPKSDMRKLISAEEKKLRETKLSLSRSGIRDQNIETTVHEATHQLCFNIGVLNPSASCPMWLVEGIATFFEPATYGTWRGAGRINRRRLRDYKTLVRRPQLRWLLINDATFTSPDGREIVASYARAWGLVYFLTDKHTKQFMDYVKFLVQKSPNEYTTPGQRVADFQRFFPDIAALEREWSAFMEKLR